RRTLLTWLFMVGATGVAWWVADRGLGGVEVVSLLFGLAFIKGAMVILDYMAIRHAPLLWRFVTLGWLTLVCLLIGVAYWKGLHG
ncbi:MAG: cytochrome C oxidase subunit IV family protein, partial [Azovibrio sp.]